MLTGNASDDHRILVDSLARRSVFVISAQYQYDHRAYGAMQPVYCFIILSNFFIDDGEMKMQRRTCISARSSSSGTRNQRVPGDHWEVPQIIRVT